MKNISKLSIYEREFCSWSELDGENIFITGGSGFFGTALLYSLMEAKIKLDLNIPITTIDERLSSVAAKASLVKQGVKTGFNKARVDETSAAIILQEFLDTKK